MATSPSTALWKEGREGGREGGGGGREGGRGGKGGREGREGGREEYTMYESGYWVTNSPLH